MTNKGALISIHPEHISNILNGRKIFEYRKVAPSHNVTHLALYCTAPVMKIVAVAEVLECIVDSPIRIWEKTVFGAGISRRFFKEYFKGRKVASAFSLGEVRKLTTPLDIKIIHEKMSPPQSFSYLEDSSMELILDQGSPVQSTAPFIMFVGGIHGVGKTTICKKMFNLVGYRHEAASSLIAQYGFQNNFNKRVGHIERNQSVLLHALEELRSHHSRLILDGHYTLINKHGYIEPIDIDVFKLMKPNYLILIKGNSVEISKRLEKRDNTKWDALFIEKFQEAEEICARTVAKAVGVPLRVINNKD